MSITPYTLHAASLASPAIQIGQIQDSDVSPNVAEMLQRGDSQIDATAVAIDSIDPSISFTSTMVATLIANLGISGVPISSATGFVGYLKKRSPGATYTSGSTHTSLTVKKGVIVPVSLTASLSSAAMSVVVHTSYDGTNLPIVKADSVALPAISPLTKEMYVCGPAAIEGTAVGGVQSITINFGLSVNGRRGDGKAFFEEVFIDARNPSVSIRTINAGLFGATALPLDGKAIALGTTKFWLTKCAEGATRVANATEEHISFVINKGMATCQPLSVSDGGDAAFEIRITPVWNGTNDWAVIDTTAAIS